MTVFDAVDFYDDNKKFKCKYYEGNPSAGNVITVSYESVERQYYRPEYSLDPYLDARYMTDGLELDRRYAPESVGGYCKKYVEAFVCRDCGARNLWSRTSFR